MYTNHFTCNDINDDGSYIISLWHGFVWLYEGRDCNLAVFI